MTQKRMNERLVLKTINIRAAHESDPRQIPPVIKYQDLIRCLGRHSAVAKMTLYEYEVPTTVSVTMRITFHFT